MTDHGEDTIRLRVWNWATIDEKEKEYWLTPSKDVFEFALYLRRCRQRKVYDLGCGIGRNLSLLIEMGFEVHGSDYSLDAVDEMNRRLEEMKYANRVKHESMTEISEPDESFDAVIAYNVVYHAYRADMRKALTQIHRVLKSGGSLLVTFQSKRSPSYVKEWEVEPGTIIRREGHEVGVPHHFVDRSEVVDLLLSYRVVDLSHVEHEYNELRSKGCHFVVTATKS